MLTSAEILSHNARKIGASVQTHQGLGWMLLTKDDRSAEMWFTDTGKISRAETFQTNSSGNRTRVQGRHFRRQILRWLRGE